MRIHTLLAIAISIFTLYLTPVPLVAQCVPDSTLPYVDGIYPDTLAPAQGCDFYDVDITFVFPQDTTAEIFPGQFVTLAFNSFTIDGLAGLPQGMSWECNLAPGCVYDTDPDNPVPDSVGCIRIFGTPTIPSTYQIVAYVTANLELVGDQPTTFELELEVLPCQFTGDCYTYSTTSNCEPAELSVENNVLSNGKAGFSYGWSFTGPNGFSYQTADENPLPQQLTDAGDYIIDYTATVDTLGFILTDATISAVNCSDLIDAGDIYWILKNPADSILVNTDGNQIVNGGSNLPIVTNLPNFVLDTGTYEFQVWDHDDIGNDDGCADGTGGGGASVFFTIPLTSPGPLTVINNGLTVTFDILNPIDTITCSDTIRIDALPAIPQITTPGSDIICDGDTAWLTTDFADSLQWYRDGLPLLNAHDTVLMVMEAGSYSVEVINPETLCTQLSDGFTMTVNTTPVPSIAFDGNQTFTVASPNTDYTYTWYKDDVAVGMGDPFVGNSTGTYHATATDNATGCESGPSAPIEAMITALDALAGLASDIRISPNPNSGQFQIELNLLQAQQLQLRMTDIYGKAVYAEQLPPQSGWVNRTWNLDHLPAGIYLIHFEWESGSLHRKVVIQ